MIRAYVKVCWDGLVTTPGPPMVSGRKLVSGVDAPSSGPTPEPGRRISLKQQAVHQPARVVDVRSEDGVDSHGVDT